MFKNKIIIFVVYTDYNMPKTPKHTTNLSIINWRQLSILLTGHPENLRKHRIPKAQVEKMKDLELLVDFWMEKYKLK